MLQERLKEEGKAREEQRIRQAELAIEKEKRREKRHTKRLRREALRKEKEGNEVSYIRRYFSGQSEAAYIEERKEREVELKGKGVAQ